MSYKYNNLTKHADHLSDSSAETKSDRITHEYLTLKEKVHEGDSYSTIKAMVGYMNTKSLVRKQLFGSSKEYRLSDLVAMPGGTSYCDCSFAEVTDTWDNAARELCCRLYFDKERRLSSMIELQEDRNKYEYKTLTELESALTAAIFFNRTINIWSKQEGRSIDQFYIEELRKILSAKSIDEKAVHYCVLQSAVEVGDSYSAIMTKFTNLPWAYSYTEFWLSDLQLQKDNTFYADSSFIEVEGIIGVSEETLLGRLYFDQDQKLVSVTLFP